MENVTPSEAWGVSGGVPSGVTVALKNGWLPLNTADTDWQIDSIGWVSGMGKELPAGCPHNRQSEQQYGIDTIDQISTWFGRTSGDSQLVPLVGRIAVLGGDGVPEVAEGL